MFRITKGFLAALLACAATAAFGQQFPGKVVRLVVPFPPGGSAEAQARVIAQKMQELWGQPVIIENRPGGGTTVGAGYVAKSAPDGYTLLMAYMVSHASSVGLYRNLPYDPVKGFAPVSLVAMQPLVLAVTANSRFGTVRDLVEAAKAAPGTLTYSSSGTGASPHLSAELFTAQAGIRLVHVPFKGASPALVALLGGQVDASFQDASVLSNVQAGKLRALAVTTGRRWSQLPNVPTIAEAGYPGYDVTSSGMILAPAGTPRDVVQRINATIRQAIAAPEVRERYASMGFDVASSTPEELEAMMATEVAKYGKIIRELGLKAE